MTKFHNPYLSIIIPAYNEEKRILASLERTATYLNDSDMSYEILVVDDGSTDRTREVVRDFAKTHNAIKVISNTRNRGKGYSVKAGFEKATGKYLLFSDADLSTPIEEIEKLLKIHSQGFDIVIASRALKDSNIIIHQPWYREMMGRFFNFLVRIFVVPGFKDTQCGFKSFSREAGRQTIKMQQMERFSFDVEQLYIAKKLGYKIKEVPVRWLDSRATKVSAFKDSLNMFRDLLKIRINDLLGKYNVSQHRYK